MQLQEPRQGWIQARRVQQELGEVYSTAGTWRRGRFVGQGGRRKGRLHICHRIGSPGRSRDRARRRERKWGNPSNMCRPMRARPPIRHGPSNANDSLYLPQNGVVAGLSPGKGYVDVSTVDAETSRKIGEAVAATGASFLEAPVSGEKSLFTRAAILSTTHNPPRGLLSPPRCLHSDLHPI